MADTVAEIVNAALVQLGSVGGLANVDDTTYAGTVANQIYAITRDALLASHPWNFASSRTQIAADADDNEDPVRPAFGWDLQYTLPADCLKVIRLNSQRQARVPWDVEGRKLLTDEVSPIEISYIARITNVAQWPPGFTDAMVHEIAARLARAIAETAGVAIAARTSADRQIATARWEDAKEKGRRAIAPGPLIAAHQQLTRRDTNPRYFRLDLSGLTPDELNYPVPEGFPAPEGAE